MKNPNLSIVIPAYNEENCIAECIKSLKKQTYKNFEIIIVDDGSKDKTREIVKSFKEIKLISGQHNGPGASRNLGAKQAKGKILVFVDADMTFDKDYLKYLIKPLSKGEVIGVENEIQISSNFESNIWSRCWGKFFFNGKNKDRKIFRAIKKSEFFRMNGFDSMYGYGDDQTFFIKYGVKPDIAKGAICYHKAPENFKEVYKQSKWIASSNQNGIFDMPIIKYIVPLLFLIASPILWFAYSFYKLYKNKDAKILLWIFIFSFTRIYGIAAGLFKKVYWRQNVR